MPRYGVREICDVVLKAKGAQKIGNKVFYAGEPICYFDTLKSSSMEAAATTVYAQGGRGNARLMAWEGERTVTFTMEDALISPESFMILSGAGLIDASDSKTIKQHMTETVEANGGIFEIKDSEKVVGFFVHVSEKPYLPTTGQDNFAYAMLVSKGEIVTEPYIVIHGKEGTALTEEATADKLATAFGDGIAIVEDKEQGYWIKIATGKNYYESNEGVEYTVEEIASDTVYDSVLMDYYVEHASGAKEIQITADKFGGNYYLEASTLWRDTNGVDWPAEFVIPNCKIQSNFTFTMASSGDPSTFTFTMDAFPDYTKFNKTEKVFSAIQVIEPAGAADLVRTKTAHDPDHDSKF